MKYKELKQLIHTLSYWELEKLLEIYQWDAEDCKRKIKLVEEELEKGVQRDQALPPRLPLRERV